MAASGRTRGPGAGVGRGERRADHGGLAGVRSGGGAGMRGAGQPRGGDHARPRSRRRSGAAGLRGAHRDIRAGRDRCGIDRDSGGGGSGAFRAHRRAGQQRRLRALRAAGGPERGRVPASARHEPAGAVASPAGGAPSDARAGVGQGREREFAFGAGAASAAGHVRRLEVRRGGNVGGARRRGSALRRTGHDPAAGPVPQRLADTGPGRLHGCARRAQRLPAGRGAQAGGVPRGGGHAAGVGCGGDGHRRCGPAPAAAAHALAPGGGRAAPHPGPPDHARRCLGERASRRGVGLHHGRHGVRATGRRCGRCARCRS